MRGVIDPPELYAVRKTNERRWLTVCDERDPKLTAEEYRAEEIDRGQRRARL
jgi:hypothetical protein